MYGNYANTNLALTSYNDYGGTLGALVPFKSIWAGGGNVIADYLHVIGSGVWYSNKLGVGTLNPTNTMHVHGRTTLDSNVWMHALATNGSPVSFLGKLAGGEVVETAVVAAASGTNMLTQTNGVNVSAGSSGTINWTTGVTGYVAGAVVHLGVSAAGEVTTAQLNTASNAVVSLETTRNAAVSNAVVAEIITASNTLYSTETTRNAAVSNALVTLLVANDTTTSNGLVNLAGAQTITGIKSIGTINVSTQANAAALTVTSSIVNLGTLTNAGAVNVAGAQTNYAGLYSTASFPGQPSTHSFDSTNGNGKSFTFQSMLIATNLTWRFQSNAWNGIAAPFVVGFSNILFVGGFLNVATCFVTSAADIEISYNRFDDTATNLNWATCIKTSATANASDGLRIIGNTQWAIDADALAFISILEATDRLVVQGNYVTSASAADIGHFMILGAFDIKHALITDNILNLTGDNNAQAVGIFLTGSSSASNGVIARNYCGSLDTTGELFDTATLELHHFENYATGTVAKSGTILPAIEA